MTNKRTLTLLILIALLALPVTPPASAGPQAKTYTVNSDTGAADANPGDGVCATAGGNCTLRAAIQEANLDGDYSTINFASQFQGTQAIPGCSLPALTEANTTIDASNRWDVANDRPGVEISGSTCDLLVIQSSGNTVLGIFFGGSGSTGVHITAGSLNFIGGHGSGQRNVFLTGVYGVWIQGTGTYNYVLNSYFGTVDGATLPGGGIGMIGVYVVGSQSISIISNNLIVGQSEAGIVLNATNNVVTDNIIGLSWNKSTALANGVGIILWSGQNVVGPDNVIAGNTGYGVKAGFADDTSITGNWIGYSTASIGNGDDGIYVYSSPGTQIGSATNGNIITNNGGNGVETNGSTVTLEGNTITDNSLAGVYMEYGGGRIGGSNSTQRNVISDNGGNGVHLNATDGVTVTGNYIGLGTYGIYDHGNQGHGILVENGATDVWIGGTGVGEGNWIAYNHGSGIYLTGSSTRYNFVLGNVLGAPVSWGWEAANHNHGVAIYDGAYDNYIGWDGTPAGGNTILSSGWSGIAIVNSDDNAVLANYIGTNGAGVNWGNAFYGIDVVNSSGTSIKSNEIAYNGTDGGTNGAEAGVLIDGSTATGNMISGNSIHDNDGPGIKLDNGGNHNLAAPVITSADCGSVVGTACANCWIEFFSDNDDEGQVYEGYFTTDPGGNFSWSGTLNGPNVTATAMGPGSAKDTSPFSASFNVGACNTSPTAAFTVNPTSGYTTTVYHFDASGCSDTQDATSALQVRWDWDNNGFYDTGWSTTKTASHSYTSVGTYTVRLEVMDTPGLKDTVTHQVRVSVPHLVYLPLVVRNFP